MPFRRHVLAVVLLVAPLAGRAADSARIELWPEGVPGLRADASPEQIDGPTASNVHHPYLIPFLASREGAVGTAIIVCPGGGYRHLSIENEGSLVAARLNTLGVTAFVLHYRLGEYGHPAPLRDVLRAIRLVRSRAAEFGVQPDRTGVLGASAGGHLAACAATLYDDPDGRTGAPLDRVNARPDFAVLLYPVITMTEPYAHAGSRRALLGPHPTPEAIAHLSVEQHVTKDTPPTFIVQTEDDHTVPVENSLMFYEALHRAGVPAELHLWPHGPHGFGMHSDIPGPSSWPDRLEEWMRRNGWLTPPVTRSPNNP